MSRKEDDRRSRIDDALERVIKDTEGAFDECLVDRLFEAIVEFRRIFCRNVWLHHNIEYYTEVGDSINLARLLRYHACLSKSDPPLSLEIIRAFVSRLAEIVLQDKTPITVAALSLLFNLVDQYRDRRQKEFGYIKIVKEQQYENSFAIHNVIDVLKHCMVTTRVYQVQELSRKIFQRLVFESEGIGRQPSRLLCKSILDTVKELLFERNSRLMHIIVCELLRYTFKGCESEMSLRLIEMVKQRYDECLKLPGQPHLDLLSKCMSYVETPSSVVINQLTECNNLEAIISYSTSPNKSIFADDKSLMYFIFYPILTRCNTDDAQVLIGRLILSREEKNFVDRNLEDKHVIQCLSYLHKSMDPKKSSIQFIRPRLRLYTMETVLEYFKTHYDTPRAFKSLTLCCDIMMNLKDELSTYAQLAWLTQAIETFHELTERTEYESFANKPIFLRMLQLLGKCQHMYFENGNHEKMLRHWIRTNKLAARFSDPDVLTEFAQYYYLVESNAIPVDLESDAYVHLVWNHILPISLDQNHSELTGWVASVLMLIDLRLSGTSLATANITRHKDIPNMIGKILMDNIQVHSVFEQIIKSMADGEIGLTDGTKRGYLCYLDSNTLPPHSGEALDYLVKGICCSLLPLQGEISYRLVTLPALSMLISLLQTLLVNRDTGFEQRIAKMGILDLLYDIYNNGNLHQQLRGPLTSKSCQLIAKNIKIPTEQLRDLIEPHTDRAAALADFFASKQFLNHQCSVRMDSRDLLGLESYLDDILNKDRAPGILTECY